MANLPFSVSGTRTINADSTISIAWTVKDSLGTVLSSGTLGPYLPTSRALLILRDIKEQCIIALSDRLAASDIPASFNFTFNPQDII